jgi:hypothetical protein
MWCILVIVITAQSILLSGWYTFGDLRCELRRTWRNMYLWEVVIPTASLFFYKQRILLFYVARGTNRTGGWFGIVGLENHGVRRL